MGSSPTWMSSQEKRGGSYSQFREVSSLIATGGLSAQVGRWDGSLAVKHVGDYANFRFAQDGNYHDLGNYWDMSLYVGVRVGNKRNIRLYGVADNLLNDKYSTVVGWSDPGIRFRLGAEIEF